MACFRNADGYLYMDSIDGQFNMHRNGGGGYCCHSMSLVHLRFGFKFFFLFFSLIPTYV